ncbi:hypothetical protein Hanom_Chr03g00235511 [Helianthus anomalus]
MYVARSQITDLEAEIATLKGKVQEAQADKERVEAELNARVESKDKDLAAKDVEIAELKHLEAERVKAETAEEAKKKAMEARDISTSALNVAQNNYVEAQTIVDTLITNSILNATELDEAVAALTDVARAVGHHGGYLECAQHVEEALGQPFGIRHCSVTDQAASILSHAEHVLWS